MISLLGVINFLLYGLIQYSITTNSFDFLTPLDKHIPLIPELIWVYHSLPIVMVTTVLFLAQNKKVFYTVVASFAAVMIVNSLFHLFAPSFYPRPELVPMSLSEHLLAWTYTIDGAHNTFPSTHVSYAFLMVLTAGDTQKGQRYPILKYAFILWAVCVILSTLVLKQHYIADVVAALLLTGLIYKAISNYIKRIPPKYETTRVSSSDRSLSTDQRSSG